MRIIFSRKGFDSSAGGAPSPILGGVPISLPIPEADGAPTTYAERGLGELVSRATNGRLGPEDRCHDDPLFAAGQCWFGQCHIAQRHLALNGVGAGDVFLFFGLFADEATGERHHRIFGYLQIAGLAPTDRPEAIPGWEPPPRAHPHLAGTRERQEDTIYFGRGGVARRAAPALRLTRPGGPLNRWIVPPWLRRQGLTYHGKPARWLGESELDSAKRGQEFVSNIGDDPEARGWLAAILAEIEG